ncbi:Guanine nucleotide-binding protein, partial [Phytophthora palmivora]
ARDPQRLRSVPLVDGLEAKGQWKVVTLLDKIDRVSVETAQKWVTYLRRFHPTIPVRALNSKISDNSKKTKQEKGHKALYDRQQEISGMRDNGEVQPLIFGSDELAGKTDRPISVAVVGYPNVGKRTLIKDLADLELDQHDLALLRHDLTRETCDLDITVDDYDIGERRSPDHDIATSDLMFMVQIHGERNMLRKGGDPDILMVARTFLQNLGKGVYSPSCQPPAKSKSRFELPAWYKKLDLSKLSDAETLLYSSNPTGHKRVLTFKAAPVSHAAGETTEYDLVMGELPENDGLTSEDDDEDGDADMDDEEEEEMNDDEE